MGIKKNVIKTIIGLLIILLGVCCLPNKTEAASFSITSGISSITVGESYTITINAPNLTGRFNISHSSNVSVNVNSVWVEDGKAETTIRVTTEKTGTATVTLTPDTETGITDTTTSELVEVAPRTDTVTVNEKSSSSSGGDDQENQGDNNSGGSNNSGNNNSGSSSESNTPTFTEVNETVYATGSVNVRSSYSTSSSVIGSLSEGDSVTRTGRGSNGWSRVRFNGQTAYISSQYLTTEKPEEKSNNKNLSSLSIEPYTLTPEFNPEVTEYTLTVGANVESIDVKAEAEDENATVEITGNDNLLMGDNTIEIKVTAEDETVRTYTINVTKEEGEQLALTELSVTGYTLTPEFSGDVYDYTIDISDTTVTNLDVKAVSNDENTTIEIVGNTDLKVGENIITILVKSEDGNNIVTYQITANINAPAVATTEDNNNMYLYIGIAVAVIIVIIIIVIIIRRRRANEEDYYESPEDDNLGTNNFDYNGNDNLFNTDVRNELKPTNKTEETFNNDFVSPDEFKKDIKEKKDNVENKNLTDDKDNIDNNEQKDVFNEAKRNSRKSVIEENFGADIKPMDWEDNDRGNRRKGKHF